MFSFKNRKNESDDTGEDEVRMPLTTALETPISNIEIKDDKYAKCISFGDKNFTCSPADKKNVQGKYLKYGDSRVIKRELKIYNLLDNGLQQTTNNETIVGEPLDKDGIFHIKMPETCNPSPSINNDIKNTCLVNNSTLAPVGMIMIIKDGGKTLNDYANKCIGYSKNSVNNTDVQLEISWFWVRAHDILYGLYIFNKNGLMHYNIYPSHILFKYDSLKPDESKMYLIDYSKTRNRGDILHFISNGEKSFPSDSDLFDYPFLQLFYYPPETFLLNSDEFRTFTQLSTNDINDMIENITDDILNNAAYTPNKKRENKKNPYYAKSFFDSFFPFMQYTMIGKNELNLFSRYMKDFNEFLITIAEEGTRNLKPTYTKMLELNLKSFDTYGFGLSMLCVLKRSFHIIEPSAVKVLNNFFYSLIHPNVFKRNTNVLSIMLEYEEILYELHFLDNVKRYFQNHILTVGNKVQNPLILSMTPPPSTEHSMPTTKPPAVIDGKKYEVSSVPVETYNIMYNFLKFNIPRILNHYSTMKQPMNINGYMVEQPMNGYTIEQQFSNYIITRYPKINIQRHIFSMTIDAFVNELAQDPELAKQYENCITDISQILQTAGLN